MGFRSFSKICKTVEKISAFSSNVNRQQKGIWNSAKIRVLDRGCWEARFLEQKEGFRATGFTDSTVQGNVLGRFKGNSVQLKRFFGSSAGNGGQLDRDFLAQLWIADRKLEKSRDKRRRKVVQSKNYGEQVYDAGPQGRWFSGSAVPEENSYEQGKPVLRQPPVSQSITDLFKPACPEEVQVAPLLARSNLLITRDIEWANLVLGFEQENRYAVVDVCYPQSPVGFIREQSNVIARQLLRLRRPFVAYITDGMGNELFRVRRPFWWITSSIYAEVNGKEIGVVHRRWHLWRRVYDLYLGNKQFAVVENPGFWNWTFTLKDINGEVLAEIDRDWRGFGFEIFTDAGQYVIRFGTADSRSKTGPAKVIQELDVTRPLTLLERAVTVALAISLDNDYFSRHGGWGLPFIAVGE
ncbi:altered inheritance rate of mitochondria protein 25-like isoform X1 [Mangifera indica]|uniref:altered inheritance rate of mitochondria protein 25-like isoform X1 n=2 Tax=Mangifera indica TaxID=29780 RepID=UPI001CF92F2C|nr:altered inheritance rate of mitochondria protein 25-like isoform X1 [Mangifera indica]